MNTSSIVSFIIAGVCILLGIKVAAKILKAILLLLAIGALLIYFMPLSA